MLRSIKIILLPLLVSMVSMNSGAADPHPNNQPGNCPESGFIDAPQFVDSVINQAVSGWVLSSQEIDRIDIKVAGQTVATGKPEIERNDVAAAFPTCTSKQRAGFIIPLYLSQLPPATRSVTVEAYTVDNDKFDLGSIPADLDKPFADMDLGTPISWQGSRSIRGWSVSRYGQVSIKVYAQGEQVASGKTTIARADVGSLYPNWKNAANSGFDISIPFNALPLGEYSLTLKIEDENGNFRILQGPKVENDTSIAFINMNKSIRLDGENVIRGWAISKSGYSTVEISALGHQVALLDANRPRDDVGKMFSKWKNGHLSGFEKLLSFRQLPRGNYPLKFKFSDSSGVYQTSTGPMVDNDFPIGRVLTDDWSLLNPDKIEIAAWIADEDEIQRVELVNESGVHYGSLTAAGEPIPYPPRKHQEVKYFGQPNPAVKLGLVYKLTFEANKLPKGVTRLNVRVRDVTGAESLLAGPLVVHREIKAVGECDGEPFLLFMPGESFFLRRGFKELHDLKSLADSECIKVGFRGRVEYLRMTVGEKGDYRFDPDFPYNLRVQSRGTMTSTPLAEILQSGLEWDIPLLITLDAGPWADAKFSAPSTDIVDVLEENELNVQWNQYGYAEEDDALARLPGSYGSPELARMMNLNIYNNKFRYYKQRNLQSAVRHIIDHESKNQTNFIAVNLDPDQYINPWFYKTQWYDYNPNTLKQFRHWLTGTDAYGENGNLVSHKHIPSLSLADINRIAGRQWEQLDEVEPPRKEPDYNDEWHQLWTRFKRHLVAAHYEDLATWVRQAGLDASRIFTSQTFIQSDVSISGDDASSGWTDEAGVSVAGSKPVNGHLGAILYGPASRNEGSVRSGDSLFQNIRDIDNKWGIVELHPATIEFVEKLSDHSESYQTVEQIFNYGARFISPMWGSHEGDRFVYPERFRSYHSFVGTKFEYQLMYWLLYRQNMPAGSLSYPFGNHLVQSTDGWTADSHTRLDSRYGAIGLASTRDTSVFKSPRLGQLSFRSSVEIRVSGDWDSSITAKIQLRSLGKVLSNIELERHGEFAVATIPIPVASAMDQMVLVWQDESGAPLRDIVVEDIKVQ
jgi:hypothetical protein